MDYQVVATVPNKACNLLKRIPLKLDCGIVISQLEPEHYGVLCRYDDPGMEAITAHHKGVTASFKNEYLKDKAYSDILTCLCFALNFFSEKGFVTFHRVYKVTNVRRVVAKEKLFNPCDPFPSSAGSNFSMRNDVSIKQFEDLFLGAVAALGKEKSMRVTYDRFVLAQSRTDLQSKVIDLAICLESLFPSGSEISFKFSLFGAHTGTEDIDKRTEIFDLLKCLYNARSKIVHGSGRKNPDLKKVEEKWERIVDIARHAVL